MAALRDVDSVSGNFSVSEGDVGTIIGCPGNSYRTKVKDKDKLVRVDFGKEKGCVNCYGTDGLEPEAAMLKRKDEAAKLLAATGWRSGASRTRGSTR